MFSKYCRGTTVLASRRLRRNARHVGGLIPSGSLFFIRVLSVAWCTNIEIATRFRRRVAQLSSSSPTGWSRQCRVYRRHPQFHHSTDTKESEELFNIIYTVSTSGEHGEDDDSVSIIGPMPRSNPSSHNRLHQCFEFII